MQELMKNIRSHINMNQTEFAERLNGWNNSFVCNMEILTGRMSCDGKI